MHQPKATFNLVQGSASKQLSAKPNSINTILQNHYVSNQQAGGSKQIFQQTNHQQQQPPNGSYLQLSKQNKKVISSATKINTTGSQNIQKATSPVVRNQHRLVANNNTINVNNVNPSTQVKMRQSSIPLMQPTIFQNQQADINNLQLINRVRSLSPMPTSQNVMKLLPSPNQLTQNIMQLTNNKSSQKLVDQQQQVYSPIKYISVSQHQQNQQFELIKKLNDHSVERLNGIKTVESIPYYSQHPLQLQLQRKEIEIVSPKNYPTETNQTCQSYLKLDPLIQSSVTRNVFDSGMTQNRYSIIDRYIKKVENIAQSIHFVQPTIYTTGNNHFDSSDDERVKKASLGSDFYNQNLNSQVTNQQILSVPLSDQQTASTFNQYDEIILKETEHLNKKIDEIFQSAENAQNQEYKEPENNMFPLMKSCDTQLNTQLQDMLSSSVQDKISITTLENQLREKDNDLQQKSVKIAELEQCIENQDSKFRDLSTQISLLLSENNSLKEQMEQGSPIPSHVTSEIENLKNNIKLYEQQVQKVVQSEIEVRKQLEIETQTKLSLNNLIEELEFQLSRSQVPQQQQPVSPCNSDVSKDEIINELFYEKTSLKDQKKKMLAEIEQMKEEQQRILLVHEKEMKKLKDDKLKYENELRINDDKHKKKHSFVQAENSYVLGQLTVMKVEIDEKTAEIEKLKAQIQVLEQNTHGLNNNNANNNAYQYETEMQQMTLHYQRQLEQEQIRYSETCQTYELEILHYKQQIQNIIDQGNGSAQFDERLTQLKNEISQQEQKNEKNLIQIYLLTTKNEELEKDLIRFKSSPSNQLLSQ